MYLQVENLIVEIPFPKSVLNVTLTPSQGRYSFDPVTKIMTWDAGKIDVTKLPNIRGSVSIFISCINHGTFYLLKVHHEIVILLV